MVTLLAAAGVQKWYRQKEKNRLRTNKWRKQIQSPFY